MHLAYVDDSGDSRFGVTLTALIVEDRHWSGLLEAWLAGRRDIHTEFGIQKNRELHATRLYKDPDGPRAAAGRVMLTALARFEHFEVVTLGSSNTRKPEVYSMFIEWLENWAAERDTTLMVFYDGQQGLGDPGQEPTAEQQKELWTTAVRNAGPYRRAHRDLPLKSRRIVEDVVMQDSRFSQLIQAADLLAYGAYQKHRQDHPEIWRGPGSPRVAAIRAYMRTHGHWPAGSDVGVYWLG